VTRISEIGRLAVTSYRNTLLWLLAIADVALNSPILVTLMMGVIRSSETPVHTRATLHNIPKDDILHSYRRENLKYYIALTGWTLYRRRKVSPVRYKLGFHIPEEEGLLQRNAILKKNSYIFLL
jgi:hypothetical protein